MIKEWDAFISHATEDKEDFVRPLATALRQLGVNIWYDEFSLEVGDSLARSIDKGLANSDYGIVVISPSFIRKQWPERELRGLVAREVSEEQKVILPIWLDVTKQEVLTFSPPLADTIAIRSEGMDAKEIALSLVKTIRPDIYKQHPRAELENMLTGEALHNLQKAKSLPVIEPLEVKVREMFVTSRGEVTDSREDLFGEPNTKRPVAIADFQRMPDRYSEPFVNVRTRIIFLDGPTEEHHIDDGFWFKSERHRTQFQPGDVRKLVVAVFLDEAATPYQGKFKRVRASFIDKLSYFEIDRNALTIENLKVIVEVVGTSPRNVTVLSISVEYLLTLNPPSWTLVDVRRHDLG